MGRWVILVVALLGNACNPSASDGIDVPADGQGTMQVASVEVRITPSVPRQVSVRVQGVLEDGCTSLGAIRQRREGNTITVTITTNHSGARLCAAVAQRVDETVRLEGEFPPSEYVLRVNGVERRFRI